MPTEILVSSDPWENRVAILEDGQLAEIYFEREEKVIGSIYKGKVMNVLPGMGASFVDIGLGRNAFLYVDDINKTPLNIGDVEITQGRSGWTITEKISKGDDVLVQIVKEPRGLKGARISTNISLPGRYLILMPTGKYSGVSRKIESADERNRLKGIMKLIRPEGMATVVRTAASGVSQAELLADLGVLIRMWHGILESYKRAPAPSLIHKDMNLVYKAARDFITPEVDRVLIDSPEEFEKVRDFMRLLGPQYVERIALYNHGRSLFKDFKVDEEVQKLLRPKINLPSGGSLVIETTEALTVIDINSGKFTGGKNLEDTIVKTNIEAAAEIARQVRLRDIGGIIVCDFIDMSSEASRNRVLATLETGLRKDRTRTTIQSFSALGLLEFTRKRIGKDLSAQLRGACPTCSGLGTVMSPESVAIDAFRHVRRLGHEHQNGSAEHRPIEVVSAPTVGAQIDYWYETELEALEKELGTKVAVRVDAALHPEKTRIEYVSDAATLDAAPPVRVGDEIEVELLHVRLPVATSALAVVGNRLVEVENAAGAAGSTVRIKVLDVDDDGSILAETRGAVAAVASEGKKRRRRGGRGRAKPLTAAEQEEQLRELAEEAARGLGGRPALGISTTAEAEAEEAEAREHVPTSPPLATVPAAHVPEYAAVDSDGEQRTFGTYGGTADAEQKRRRRRRRRRRGGANDTATLVAIAEAAGIPLPPGIQAPAAVATPAAIDEEDESAPVAAAGGQIAGEPGRRRRRRRRRRGRGGAEGRPGDAVAAQAGESYPLAQVREVSAAVALSAPPPSLSVESEPVKLAKPARGRRLRAAAAAAPAQLETAATPLTALPAPEAPKRRGRPPKAAAQTIAAQAPASAAPPVVAAQPVRAASPAPPTEAATPAAVAEAPKRGRKKAAAVAAAPAAKKASGTTAVKARKAPATRKTAALKTPAKAPAAKATAVKASSSKAGAAKAASKGAAKAPSAKAASAKKTPTARKKKSS